jgi:hypothetical protein
MLNKKVEKRMDLETIIFSDKFQEMCQKLKINLPSEVKKLQLQ